MVRESRTEFKTNFLDGKSIFDQLFFWTWELADIGISWYVNVSDGMETQVGDEAGY